jgi:hypothetical protein
LESKASLWVSTGNGLCQGLGLVRVQSCFRMKLIGKLRLPERVRPPPYDPLARWRGTTGSSLGQQGPAARPRAGLRSPGLSHPGDGLAKCLSESRKPFARNFRLASSRASLQDAVEISFRLFVFAFLHSGLCELEI